MCKTLPPMAGAADIPYSPPSAPVRRRALLTQDKRTVLRRSGIIFLATFLIYWLTGPMGTAFDFQLSQANNILHGHLDLVPEYTHNLNILERVLYDGHGFCIPADDPRGPGPASQVQNPRITADCKQYMQHSLGPALLLLPLVLLFGLTVNQTLVGVFFGALTAVLAYGIARRFTDNLRTQVWLTVFAAFGTQIFYSGADGSVWHFAHTTAVFFLFAAIYAAVVRRSPLLSGAMIGAAFMCRPSTLLGVFFVIVAFADLWLVAAPAGKSVLSRIRLRPLIAIAVGLAPFLLLTGVINALRFGSPFESGYSYSEQIHQTALAWVYGNGIFNLSYIPLHIRVAFEQMPNISTMGSYVWPSWNGMAIWAVSPPLLYALFVHLKRYRVATIVAVISLAAACLAMLGAAFWNGWFASGTDFELPMGIQLLPFWILIGTAVVLALVKRDRIAVACWAAIIPIALLDFTFAATGWAQFGYRYSLDFIPFLFLLVVLAVRGGIKWHHVLLLTIAVLVNIWGPLWIFKLSAYRRTGCSIGHG